MSNGRSEERGSGNQAEARSRPTASLEKSRALMGLLAVLISDVAVTAAAIVGIIYVSRNAATDNASSQVVAIISSAFTAVSAMTTAYFGIKAATNTANNALAGVPGPAESTQVIP